MFGCIEIQNEKKQRFSLIGVPFHKDIETIFGMNILKEDKWRLIHQIRKNIKLLDINFYFS